MASRSEAHRGEDPSLSGPPPPFNAARSELVRQPDARLGTAVVETGEAPGLEDRRRMTLRRDEVALADVQDEVVAQHVVDVPEGLHAELVGRVDGHAQHGHDAAAAIEGEAGEREER